MAVAVAADRLDLQDVGALVRQKHGCEWTGYDGAQIEHRDAIERTWHNSLLFLCLSPGGRKPTFSAQPIFAI